MSDTYLLFYVFFLSLPFAPKHTSKSLQFFSSFSLSIEKLILFIQQHFPPKIAQQGHTTTFQHKYYKRVRERDRENNNKKKTRDTDSMLKHTSSYYSVFCMSI